MLLLTLFLSLLCGFATRSVSGAVLLLLPVLLWGTYLLGPVMQGRYLYPFICVLPLFLCRTGIVPVKREAKKGV